LYTNLFKGDKQGRSNDFSLGWGGPVHTSIVYLTNLCVNWALFGMSGSTSAQFTHERVEYKVVLFDKPIKGSKSLKIFKISLTFRFDKL
jgi:hypothetical protein